MLRTRGRATVAAAAVVLVGAVAVGSAGAAPPAVACGQVITVNTTLQGDVGPCAGDGIVVGADNITLNLNGHRIVGQNLRTGNFAGVRLPMRTGVTVVGGRLDPLGKPVSTISGFDAGVLINGGSNNSVRNLLVKDNIGPATRQAFLGDGIAVMNSANNIIHRNVVDHNGIYDGIGVLGNASHGNTIKDNTVTRTVALISETGPEGAGTGAGVVVDAFLDEATGKLIRGNNVLANVVSANDGAGISNVNTQDGRVAGNIVEDNGHVQVPGNGIGMRLGLFPESKEGRMVVENNVIRRNGGFGIYSSDSDENQYIANILEDNGFNPPLGVTGNAAISVASDLGGHLIKGNTVRRNNYTGIQLAGFDNRIQGRTDNNRIEENTVTDNANIGIVFRYRGVPEGPNSWNNYVVSNYVVNSGNAVLGDLVDGSRFAVPGDCRGAVWDDNTYEVASPPCAGSGGTQVSVPASSSPSTAVAEGNGENVGRERDSAEDNVSPKRRGPRH